MLLVLSPRLTCIAGLLAVNFVQFLFRTCVLTFMTVLFCYALYTVQRLCLPSHRHWALVQHGQQRVLNYI